jgi:hypothetical protein
MKSKPQSSTINDMVMFIPMADDSFIIAHVRSHQDDKRDYADLTRPEQPNVLRTPPRYVMAALNDLTSAAAQLDNRQHNTQEFYAFPPAEVIV